MCKTVLEYLVLLLTLSKDIKYYRTNRRKQLEVAAFFAYYIHLGKKYQEKGTFDPTSN